MEGKYKVEIVTRNNTKIIQELKTIRELTNYLWLANYCEAKSVKVKRKGEKNERKF